jgi:4-hydroxy-4-methyl-2-oxoglutarate aldolase
VVAQRQPADRQVARQDSRHQQKPVTICGIAVNPGDLVLADETGVCFIPRERAAEVLQRAQRNAAAERLREAKIASGSPVADLLGKSR